MEGIAAAKVRGALMRVVRARIGKGMVRWLDALLMQSSNGEPESKGMHSWRGARRWVIVEPCGAGRAVVEMRRVARATRVVVRKRMVKRQVGSGVVGIWR